MFVRLQLSDDVAVGVPLSESGVHQCVGILVETLDGVGVIISVRGYPGAGDGGGTLRATVEAVDSLWLCRRK